MYCEKCKRLLISDVCADCGKKHVREVREDDPCLLTEMKRLWVDMLCDVLSQHDIPHLAKSRQGAWLTATFGSFHEDVLLYVPYRCFEAAQELYDELFSVEDASDDLDEIESVL